MFKFKDQAQEEKYHKNFKKLIKNFKKATEKKKILAVRCSLVGFKNLEEQSSLITRDFFKTSNMSYEAFLCYEYLNYIWKAELIEFEEDWLKIFNPSLR